MASPGDVPAIAQIYNEGIEDRVVAFAATSAYRTRDCFAGMAEFLDGVWRDVVIVERVIPENLS